MNNGTLGRKIFLSALCATWMLITIGNVGAEVNVFQNEKMKVDLYGQVNRAVLYANDGDSDEFYNVDNDHSSTRFGIKATAQPTDKLTAGAVMEFEYQSNPSNLVWQEDANAKNETNANKLDKRILEVFLNSAFGKLSIGQGSTASDSSSEVDLSGTNVVGYSDVTAFAGGMRFFNNATNRLDVNPLDSTKDTSINSVFSNLDGLSRQNRLRYDTPKFAGFMLSASTYSENDDDAKDVALCYSADVSGGKAAAAVSYVNFNSASSKKNQYSGSASFLMNNGLNLTVAAGNQERRVVNVADATFYYGKIGYIANIFSIGATHFGIDYGTFHNTKKNDDRSDSAGFQCVQNLKDWSTELYMGYRFYDLNRAGAQYDYADIHTVMAGMRLKF